MKYLGSLFFLLLSYDNCFAANYHNKFDDWQLFSVTKNAKKYCYILSLPSNKKIPFEEKKCYFIVTRMDDEKYEINLSVENEIYGKSFLILDGDLFYLINKNHFSWAKNSTEDRKIIDKMKKVTKMQVGWYISEKERKIVEYSLRGFNQALEQMNLECD